MTRAAYGGRHDLVTRQKVYDFIVEYMHRTAGRPPTYRDIQMATGLASTSTVEWHLRHLEDEGRISRDGGNARNIIIPGARWLIPGEVDADCPGAEELEIRAGEEHSV